MEKNYGISISSSIDEINSKVISEYPSETYKINDYIDFMSSGGKYWIAWEKGLKWGPIQLKSEFIKMILPLKSNARGSITPQL